MPENNFIIHTLFGQNLAAHFLNSSGRLLVLPILAIFTLFFAASQQTAEKNETPEHRRIRAKMNSVFQQSTRWTYIIALIVVLCNSMILLICYYRWIRLITLLGVGIYVLAVIATAETIVATIYGFQQFFSEHPLSNSVYPSIEMLVFLNTDAKIRKIYIFAIIGSLILLMMHFWTDSWLINNLMALSLAHRLLLTYNFTSLRTAIIFLGLFWVYDIFWVYLSSYFAGSSVMFEAVKTITWPVMIKHPRANGTSYHILGLGDIILPGYLIRYCWIHQERLAERQRSANAYIEQTVRSSLYNITMISYAIGLGAVVILSYWSAKGQPALLTIVPAIVFASALHCYINHNFRYFWLGQREREPLQVWYKETASAEALRKCLRDL